MQDVLQDSFDSASLLRIISENDEVVLLFCFVYSSVFSCKNVLSIVLITLFVGLLSIVSCSKQLSKGKVPNIQDLGKKVLCLRTQSRYKKKIIGILRHNLQETGRMTGKMLNQIVKGCLIPDDIKIVNYINQTEESCDMY